MTTVIVTGGAGYIGSHACKALAAAGYRPVTFDNLDTGHRRAVQWGPFEPGDLLDLPRLQEALDRHRPAAVLHFAGCAYVGESVSDPLKYYRTNLGGTLNLLAAMRRSGVRHLVFSSSCTTYGRHDAARLSEGLAQRPDSPYAASKHMIERVLTDCAQAYGLRSVALRYFNAAGADPDGDSGEAHDPETHLIPRALMTAAGELEQIEIFGTRYPTPDGTCVRDYVHVSDLAVGHVNALRLLLAGRTLPAMNLGLGRGYSVREVIAAVERVTGRTVGTREAPPRPGDHAVLVADAGLARQVLGFTPRFVTLEAMVATAWGWLRRQRALGSVATRCGA